MNRGIWLVPILAAGILGALLAQDSTQQQDSKKDTSKKDQPAPLFGGKLGIKSSDSKKESATLGFNGIDPSGKVDAKMLATTPSSGDQDKVKKMAELTPSAADLDAFIQQGGLKKK